MGTFDDKAIIDELIANDGHYEDDPRVVKIVEYENFEGRTCWGVVYPGEDPNRYERPTAYVQNPRVIWPMAARGGLT